MDSLIRRTGWWTRPTILVKRALFLACIGVELADAQGERQKDYIEGEFLTSLPVRADSAERSCLVLGTRGPPPGGEESVKCRVRKCSRVGHAGTSDWTACEYERSPTGYEVVLYQAEPRRLAARRVRVERAVRPVWHGFYTGEFLRSATPAVTAHHDSVLVSIRTCWNGTGGCEEFFLLKRRGVWRPVRLAFLDSLERQFPNAIQHGFRVNARALTASAAIYSKGDANCCPSRSAEMQLRLRGDALELKAIRIEVVH
jgi:hypothetical protein